MLEFSGQGKLHGHPTLCTLGMCLFPCIHVSCSSSLVENDTLEDQQKQDGSVYIQVVEHILCEQIKICSIILASQKDAHQIICVNDPYNVSFSILCKVPGIYMKLDDQFPEFKIFLCSTVNTTCYFVAECVYHPLL